MALNFYPVDVSRLAAEVAKVLAVADTFSCAARTLASVGSVIQGLAGVRDDL
jgi:hypothetical protein